MVILYFILICLIPIIYCGLIDPAVGYYTTKILKKRTDELDAILQTVYHSEKRPLIKLSSRVYDINECTVFIHKSKDRQWYMNDLWNLRNEKPLKDWKIEYKDSKTLTYSKGIFKIILKFS